MLAKWKSIYSHLLDIESNAVAALLIIFSLGAATFATLTAANIFLSSFSKKASEPVSEVDERLRLLADDRKKAEEERQNKIRIENSNKYFRLLAANIRRQEQDADIQMLARQYEQDRLKLAGLDEQSRNQALNATIKEERCRAIRSQRYTSNPDQAERAVRSYYEEGCMKLIGRLPTQEEVNKQAAQADGQVDKQPVNPSASDSTNPTSEKKSPTLEERHKAIDPLESRKLLRSLTGQ